MPEYISPRWILADSYPYALAVYNETLNETVKTLENGIAIFHVCQIAVIILTLGLGFIIGSLSVKQRQKELALQNVLGLPSHSIYYEVFAEYIITSFLCLGLAITMLTIVSRSFLPWFYVAAILLAGCLGIAVGALPILINKDVLMMTKSE